MNWIQRFLTAITTHKADPNAHHVPTAPGWAPTGDGGTKVAAADIEAAAGIPLTKLEDEVCSETEAKSFVTKEFFVLPSLVYTGATLQVRGNHPGLEFATSADFCYFEFLIPTDFTALISAELVIIACSLTTHRLNFYSNYCADGENFEIHSETLLDEEAVYQEDRLYEISFSGVLTNIAALDYVGIRVVGDVTNTANLLILGIRFKYS